MAEFILRQQEDGSNSGAIYRDGSKVFRAFGFYKKTFHNQDDSLTHLGTVLAKGKVPLMGYAQIGTYTTDTVSWEKNASADDLDWLEGLDYE